MNTIRNALLAVALIATAVLGSRLGADGAAMQSPMVTRSDGAGLEQFQQKCAAVLRPELRKNKYLEHCRDSKKSGNALASERFRLVSGDSSCVVLRSAAMGTAPAGLTAGHDCDEVMPGLSDVRYWREEADGSVLFGSVGGVTMAAFAQADGAGYESFAPRHPLMAMVPED